MVTEEDSQEGAFKLALKNKRSQSGQLEVKTPQIQGTVYVKSAPKKEVLESSRSLNKSRVARPQQEKHRGDKRRDNGKVYKGRMMHGPREQGKDSGFYFKVNANYTLKITIVVPFPWKNTGFFMF